MSDFSDRVRADSELRREYFEMLSAYEREEEVYCAHQAPNWDEVVRARGTLQFIATLKKDVTKEERENAARRDYEARTVRR